MSSIFKLIDKNMPPERKLVWQLFNISRDHTGKAVKASCRYCPTQYAFPNATRMQTHLLLKCNKCPQNIKDSLIAGKEHILYQILYPFNINFEILYYSVCMKYKLG